MGTEVLPCGAASSSSAERQVLDRLVPLAVRGVFDLLSSKGAATSSWELGESLLEVLLLKLVAVFCGKEIKRESLQVDQLPCLLASSEPVNSDGRWCVRAS
mmetsp:Transcript_37213/g.117109  ORF Transcript_37213/g.117109 Transcript_37213/m.117109 type:complete len:101 (-) Transcript_37213:156-458(-)